MIKTIKYCGECPFHTSGKEFSECIHPKSKLRGLYENIVNPRWNTKNEIPKWCPIVDGYVKVNRDENDKIVSKVKYEVLNNVR